MVSTGEFLWVNFCSGFQMALPEQQVAQAVLVLAAPLLLNICRQQSQQRLQASFSGLGCVNTLTYR